MCLRLKDFVFCKKLTEDIYRFDNSALYKNVQNSFIHEKSPQIFIKKVFLKKLQMSQESTCIRPSNFIKKKTLAQTFSCEFGKIFENTFLYRTPPDNWFCLSKVSFQVYLIPLWQ